MLFPLTANPSAGGSTTAARYTRGWLTCPVIGDGQDFPLDKAGEPIVTPDRGPFRAAVAEREAVEGDRLEFVIGAEKSGACLVAYDVADPSNFAEHGGEILLAEADLDKAADRVAESDKLEALAQEMKVGEAGRARDVLRRVGEKIVPEFDERSYLGEADAPPTGSFLEDTMTGGAGAITGHTGEKGATWANGTGTEQNPKLDGAGYVVQGSTAGYGYAYASGTPASADYSVECGVLCSTAVSSGRKNGPLGRIDTAADTSYQWVWETNVGYELLKSVAGTKTTLATYARIGKAGEEDIAVLSMVGTAIKGFVNGVERGSATDSAISAAGKAGFRVQGSTSVGGKVNYIIATDAKVVVDLAATLSGSGTAAGTLTLFSSLAAALSGSGSLSAELRSLSSLAASLAGDGALSAELRALSSLSANLTGAGSLSAELQALASMAANLEGEGEVAALLVALANLGADTAGEGTLVALLAALVNLEASITSSGTLSGELGALADLMATVAGQGQSAGELSALASMAAGLEGQGVLGADLAALIGLEAQLSGSGELLATLTVFTAPKDLAAILSGSGTLTATMGIWPLIGPRSRTGGSGDATGRPVPQAGAHGPLAAVPN